VLPLVPVTGPGTYRIAVSGLADSTGAYSTRLILNAASEAETHGGPANDDPASAEDLQASFLTLPGASADRGAVLGTIDGTEDWYHFTLNDGQSATLAVDRLTPGHVTVELYDAGAQRLAVGISAVNVAHVINNYVDTTADGGADTYYVRVAGTAATAYSLVVTRDADFHTEPDAGQAARQDLFPANVVLGHAGTFPLRQQRKLTGSDTARSDEFGYAVSVDNDVAVVGTVLGDGVEPDTGAAYVLRFDGAQWVEEQKLVASDGASLNRFGSSVAIHGSTAIVGAIGYDGAAVNGGAAYVFRFDGADWVETQKLTASDAAAQDLFGFSVAISGDVAVVGTPYAASTMGKTYVFRFNGEQWVEEQKLTAPFMALRFGRSISIDGEQIAIGAPEDFQNGTFGGAAYVFRFQDGQWIQEQKLLASDVTDLVFGESVSLSGDRLLVGANLKGGVNPTTRGSAYVFHFDGNQWTEEQKLTAAGAAPSDWYGYCVSLHGETAVVGSTQNTEDEHFAAAYVFQQDSGIWTQRQKLVADSPTAARNSVISISDGTVMLGAAGDDYPEHDTGSITIFQPAASEYTFHAAGGEELTIFTTTPGDGSGEPSNGLDPELVLRDPAGTVVAFERAAAPDGRNVRLTHTAATAGTHTVGVRPEQVTGGEYTLSVSGHTGRRRPFAVASVVPAEGALLAQYPEQITVQFHDTALLSSLDASDLTVNGKPAGAYEMLDGRTAVCDVSAIKEEGVNEVAIAAGAVLDVQGTPIEPLAVSYTVNTTPPRVIASSLAGNETVPTGAVTYYAVFDQPLRTEELDPSDVTLHGSTHGDRQPDSLSYDPDHLILTLEFDDLPEDSYCLTLHSGDGQFESLAGSDLDGEARIRYTVPSGNRTAGGDFKTHFSTKPPAAVPPLAMTPVPPDNSLIYQSAVRSGLSAGPGFAEGFPLELDGGQTITVVAEPTETLQPTVEVLDPTGVPLAAATAPEVGVAAILQVVLTVGPGTYTVRVSNAPGTAGNCEAFVILNAAVEEEGYDRPTNDHQSRAEDLDAGFIPLDIGPGERTAVVGESGQDWYRFTLDDGQTATMLLTRSGGSTSKSLQLFDEAGRKLASSGGGVHGFRDTTENGVADSYYVRVDCQGDYSLVITRDAGFESDPPSGAAAPQDITPSGSVLGYVDCLGMQCLTASDGSLSDLFGEHVALDGEWALVGTDKAEAVYVYRNDGIQWVEHQILTAPDDPTKSRDFGESVAISGETAVVGATEDNSADESAGAVYVFHYDGANWVPQQKLTASDAADFDEFGYCVSISDNVLVVGTYEHSTTGNGIGEAYVFRFDGSQWIEQQKLLGADVAQGDRFGQSVAVSDETVVVGALDSGEGRSGAAYVFQYDGAQWLETQKLTAPQASDLAFFGCSVAIDGDVMLVGAYNEQNPGSGKGSVYVFRRDGEDWVQEDKLTASGGRFGYCVAISGDRALVGTLDVETAHLFRFDGSQWTEQRELASDVTKDSLRSVALDGGTALIGAPFADFGHTNAGAAYVVSLDRDAYSISVAAGDTLSIRTATPGDGTWPLCNTLDPAVELYDPTGTLVAADDNGAGDGRNALLSYEAAEAGVYTVRIHSADETAGPYCLHVSGSTGTLPFRVVGSDPVDGQRLPGPPTQLVLTFNDYIVPDGAAAGDLTVNGIPAGRLRWVGEQTAEFDRLGGLTEGVNHVHIDPGALVDVQGTPLEAYDGTFYVDTTPPHVIGSSVSDGDIVPTGTLLYTVWFDEELATEYLASEDAILVGQFSGPHTPRVFNYDPASSLLTLEFPDLPDDTYTLTLRSHDRYGFRDVLEHALDGAPSFPLPSGGGTAGDDFTLHFRADDPVGAHPTAPLESTPLEGSLICEGISRGMLIASPGYCDRFTLELQAGQTIALAVEPDGTLQPTVRLLDPAGQTLAAVTAIAPGENAVVSMVPVGQSATYTIVVEGASATTGHYSLRGVLHAMLEEEPAGDNANDGVPSAEDLDRSLMPLDAGSADRGAALGFLDASTEDWYRFTLQDGQSTTLALKGLATEDLALELYGAAAQRLALGVVAENTSQIIHNFVDSTADGAADSYYARVSGDTATEYALVVTRNADFETEPNWAPAQPIGPSGTVLAHVDSNPVLQWQKVTGDPSGWNNDDGFGASVAISGNTAVVGASEDDEAAGNAGAVYVYHSDGIEWSEQQKVIASDATIGAQFGCSVAIDGQRIIVGAYKDYVGDSRAGSAYVFRFDGSQWIEEQKLIASDPDEGDWFGRCVAISGETVIIGAERNEHRGDESGSAYVFRFDGNQWVQQQMLNASDADEDGRFGRSVAISGDTAIVGAALGRDHTDLSGSAYVFQFDGARWAQQQKLTASDWEDLDWAFGRSVALSGNTAIVGASGDRNGGCRSGSAYVFQFDGTDWVEQQKLVASDADADDSFGYSVSMSGDRAMVGAYRDAIDGRERGSAYVFRFDGARWVEHQKLTALDEPRNGRLGQSISISGNFGVVGGSEEAYFFAPDYDSYTVRARAGDTLTVRTATPWQSARALDPRIELYDPSGTLVAADENGGADGRNAQLAYPIADAGTYTLRVLAEDNTAGGYVLNVTGQTAAREAFRVTATDPADWDRLASPPGQMTVSFNDLVDLSSLDAADLTVNGVPAAALNMVDGKTAVFDLPGLNEGPNHVVLAASVADVQHTPVELNVATLIVDTTPPRVIASSIEEDGAVPTGTLVYTASFDEALNAAVLDPADVTLLGAFTGEHVSEGFYYDPITSQLRLIFADLPEDAYTLTLHAGDDAFEDLVGNDLDGAPSHPLPSGNGVGGHDFTVRFYADDPVSDHHVSLFAVQPSGSLIYQGVVEGAAVGAPGYIERVLLDLEAGQTLTVGTNAVSLELLSSITLLDPDGVAIGNAVAAGPGSEALVQTVPVTVTGTYTILVTGAEDTIGSLSLRVILNAAGEYESYSGPSNNERDIAEDLDPSFIPLGNGSAEPGAVVGMKHDRHADVYRFTLDDGESATIALCSPPPNTATLILRDADGNDLGLATAPTATNSTALIPDFVDTTSDGAAESYYVQVSGKTGMEYVLVITRNAALDAEPNGPCDPPQEVGFQTTVLGDVGSSPGTVYRLTASDAVENARFGTSIAASDDFVLVGAVDGNGACSGSGTAYVYRFDGSGWTEQAKLTASNAMADGCFGRSVAIDEDTILVGAPYYSYYGDASTGLTYVFAAKDGQWFETRTLSAREDSGAEYFGDSVAVSGDVVAVGVSRNDGPLQDAGAAYVYSPDPADTYAVNLDAGETLIVRTATPADGPGEFDNGLDPVLELFDSEGMLLGADDNAAADGHNAVLTYRAAEAGTYKLVVSAAEGTHGEYVLNIERLAPAEVVGRHVFYNHSAFDGNDPQAGVADDRAIAADKAALLPGQSAAFANYTSYHRGINGIMIDVVGMPDLAGLTTETSSQYFRFRVGNDAAVDTWSDAPAPDGIAVRDGAGTDASDRITIAWPDYAIKNQWLEVTVLATPATGLIEDKVFHFGNAVGETGNSTSDAHVTTADLLLVRNNPRNFLSPAPVDFPYDFNRDQRVNATDVLLARSNRTGFPGALRLIDLADVQPATRPAASPDELTWLREIDFVRETNRPSEKLNAAADAVDLLLLMERAVPI